MSTMLSEFVEVAEAISTEFQRQSGHAENCIEVTWALESHDLAAELSVRDAFGAYHDPENADGRPFSYTRRCPHHWLMADGAGSLPAGTVIDATTNQFGGHDRVRVVWPWEHAASYYLLDFRTFDGEGPSDAARAFDLHLGDPDCWWRDIHTG